MSGIVQSVCQHCGSTRDECYPVVCARCAKQGCSETMVIEEGDEWECPPCNARENARERLGPNGECPICGGMPCKPGCADGTEVL